ncbi:hypothetical protein FGO68_gene10626 [Halteria grandinella]|uniref:Rhomboid-like protease n=1 Tax=Halteria grandinella TaxID=5974 RepID=A0A8J8P8H9_HALGN|nr:hypothetical protein FGO68_gene10626 [Halteria grandinella]
MSNIRGLRDLDQESRPFIRGGQANPQAKSARDEGFLETLKSVLCPFLSYRQFTFWISIIQIAMFTATLAYNGIAINSGFLAPSTLALYDFGEKYPFRMRYNYEVHRFLMPLVLHANLNHIFSNLLSQVMLCSSLEASQYLGTRLRTALFYILSGFGGVLFSSLISDTMSVGASTSIFGFIGLNIAILIATWSQLSDQQKGQQGAFLICILLLNLTLFQGGSNLVDQYGHLGGFISGLLLGYHLLARTKTHRIFTTIALLSFYIGGLVVFYTLRKPLP